MEKCQFCFMELCSKELCRIHCLWKHPLEHVHWLMKGSGNVFGAGPVPSLVEDQLTQGEEDSQCKFDIEPVTGIDEDCEDFKLELPYEDIVSPEHVGNYSGEITEGEKRSTLDEENPNSFELCGAGALALVGAPAAVDKDSHLAPKKNDFFAVSSPSVVTDADSWPRNTAPLDSSQTEETGGNRSDGTIEEDGGSLMKRTLDTEDTEYPSGLEPVSSTELLGQSFDDSNLDEVQVPQTDEANEKEEKSEVPEGAVDAGWILRVGCMVCTEEFDSALDAYNHHVARHSMGVVLTSYETRQKDVRLLACVHCGEEVCETNWKKHEEKCVRKRRIAPPIRSGKRRSFSPSRSRRRTRSRSPLTKRFPFHCVHGPLKPCWYFPHCPGAKCGFSHPMCELPFCSKEGCEYDHEHKMRLCFKCQDQRNVL